VAVTSSYVWNGSTYTSSGTYQFNCSACNSVGCDSSAILYLSILTDTGTVTSIATSPPITGGTITTSGTIGLDTNNTHSSAYNDLRYYPIDGNYTSTGYHGANAFYVYGTNGSGVTFYSTQTDNAFNVTSAGFTLSTDSANDLPRFSFNTGFPFVLDNTLLTVKRTLKIPDKAGTIALTSDLTGGTVTSVATGIGLTGGTITTSGTLKLDTADYATALQSGVLKYADWTTFNNKGSGTVTSITTQSPITGGTITGTGNLKLDKTAIDSVGTLISGTIGSGFTAIDTARTNAVSAIGGGNGISVTTGGKKATIALASYNTAMNIAPLYAPEGFLINGKISPTVASNNLTVALQTLAGGNPSSTDPVFCRIHDTIRTITSALSLTLNAGTNWFSWGVNTDFDLFAYLGYNSIDGTVIAISPYIGMNYGEFSTTSTVTTYLAVSTRTNAISTDYYNIIGRFAATLGVTSSFNWSVPTFTAINLIQRPIYESRWLSDTALATITSINTYTNKMIQFKQSYKELKVQFYILGLGTGAPFSFTLPFASTYQIETPMRAVNNATTSVIAFWDIPANSNVVTLLATAAGASYSGTNTNRYGLTSFTIQIN